MSRDLKALCALLDKERTFLLNGDLASALSLADKKMALAERVEALPNADPEAGAALHQKAKRNGLLLQAAQDGLNTARERIHAIMLGVATRTYTSDGSRVEIPIDRKGLERRA